MDSIKNSMRKRSFQGSLKDNDKPHDQYGALAEGGEYQNEWNAFSKFLQSHNLKKKNLPFEMDVSECPNVHAWGKENSSKMKSITVKKRFNSRKLPHLLHLTNDEGATQMYIFKQEDDITMDVIVMNLFKVCNEVWKEQGLPHSLYTYEIVACPDNTGFGEIVPGDTMLNFHAEQIDKVLGRERKNWEKFALSAACVAIVTAIFNITDRHHNNTLLTPTGEMCLIDLSASLGHAAPMDKSLNMNPIYLPNRVLALREYSNILRETVWNEPPYSFEKLEARAVIGYYAIFNSTRIQNLFKDSTYKLLKPHKFATLFHERKHNPQTKEKIRNDIVKAMDGSDSLNKFFSGLAAAVGAN
eukprot:Awhi_evm1s4963